MAVLDYLLEQLDEKMDHIIKKIPSLTDDQKDELIVFFKKHPNYEKRIDWNKAKTLKYDDFKDVLATVSKTGQKKAVKVKGIEGLRKGKDYLEFPLGKKDIKGYIPLNHRASSLIGSKRIGACDTKWCTAMAKTDEYWGNEVMNTDAMLLYLLYPDTKYAVQVFPKNKVYDIFNANDDKLKELPGIDVETDILSKPEWFEKARSIVRSHPYVKKEILKGLGEKDLDVVKKLIPKGTKIPDDVDTKYSVMLGTPYTLDYLRKNTNYEFPKDSIDVAIMAGNYDVLRYLLFSGVEPTKDHLFSADIADREDMVKVIKHVMDMKK